MKQNKGNWRDKQMGSGAPRNESEGGVKTEQLALVNSRCPMTGNAINANDISRDMTANFDGQTVGFCCAQCVSEWEQLSDEEKQDRLDDVM
jgi:hypothetical protein